MWYGYIVNCAVLSLLILTVFSAKAGRPFYFNTETGIGQWTAPLTATKHTLDYDVYSETSDEQKNTQQPHSQTEDQASSTEPSQSSTRELRPRKRSQRATTS